MKDNHQITQTENIFNYLGRKSTRKELVKGEASKDIKTNDLKLGTYKVNPFYGNFRACPDKNCNFYLKKIKNRVNNKFRNAKYNLSEKKENLDTPQAPHNTSQYLIENYSEGRKRIYTPFMLVDCYENSNSNENNYEEDIDEICITGGSMKGIVNSNLNYNLNLDLDYNYDMNMNLNLEENSELSTDLFSAGEDDKHFSGNESPIQLERLNGITQDENELSKLKQIMKENEKIIKNLQNEISTKKKNTDNVDDSTTDYFRYEYS